MIKSFLIKPLSALVLAIYVLSFIGLNVHSCSCTGEVCVTLAAHGDHHHCTSHHHDCCHDKACHNETCHHDHGCCHDKLFKLIISGDSDHSDLHINMNAPMVAYLPPAYPVESIFGADQESARIIHHISPHPGDILRSICVMRI